MIGIVAEVCLIGQGVAAHQQSCCAQQRCCECHLRHREGPLQGGRSPFADCAGKQVAPELRERSESRDKASTNCDYSRKDEHSPVERRAIQARQAVGERGDHYSESCGGEDDA